MEVFVLRWRYHLLPASPTKPSASVLILLGKVVHKVMFDDNNNNKNDLAMIMLYMVNQFFLAISLEKGL